MAGKERFRLEGLPKHQIVESVSSTFETLFRNAKKIGFPDITNQVITGYVTRSSKGTKSLVIMVLEGEGKDQRNCRFICNMDTGQGSKDYPPKPLPYQNDALAFVVASSLPNELEQAKNAMKNGIIYTLKKSVGVDNFNILLTNDFVHKQVKLYISVLYA